MLTNFMIATLASGIGLLTVVIVLRTEARLDRRLFLAKVRQKFDEVLLKIFYYLAYIRIKFGAGTMRVLLHSLFAFTLGILIRMLTYTKNWFERMRQQNKTVATVVKKEQEKTHLDVIAEHRKLYALTEEEKAKLKEDAYTKT